MTAADIDKLREYDDAHFNFDMHRPRFSSFSDGDQLYQWALYSRDIPLPTKEEATENLEKYGTIYREQVWPE